MYLGKRYMTQFPSSNFTMCISSLVMYITDKKKKKKKSLLAFVQSSVYKPQPVC